MKGWKTWTAGSLAILYGIGGLVFGLHDVDAMMGFTTSGLGMIGLGHKIEKQSAE
jgi:hypothetical protein